MRLDQHENHAHLAGDPEETVQAALWDQFHRESSELDRTWLRALEVPKSDDEHLSPRLRALREQIMAAGSYKIEDRGGTRFVCIASPDGGRRMAAVSDEELAVIARETGIEAG